MGEIKSESVWYRQVYKGFQDYLSSIISVDGEPLKVVVRTEDADFKIEHYPCASLYIMSDSFDRKRYNNNFLEFVVGYNEDKSKAYIEQGAKPYAILIQVSFWTKSQSQLDSMIIRFNSLCPIYINLSVKDTSGEDRNIFCRRTNALRQDDIEKGERIFRYAVTLRCNVELDETDIKEVSTVTERIFTRKEMGGKQ